MAALLAAACDRPRPLVICHNANCAEDSPASEDDTLVALERSLALEVDGRPAFDGVELDLFWHQGRCLFAHDVAFVDTAEDAATAANVVAEYLRNNTVVAFNGDVFVVKLELKPQVGATDAESHVECGFAVMQTLADAAAAGGHELEVLIDSFDPVLLRAAQGHPDRARVRLSADFGVPPPLGPDNRPLSDFGGIRLDVAEIHPSWITDTALHTLRSMDVELTVWMFDVTPETLDGIERLDPRYVVAPDARLLRRWLQW